MRVVAALVTNVQSNSMRVVLFGPYGLRWGIALETQLAILFPQLPGSGDP